MRCYAYDKAAYLVKKDCGMQKRPAPVSFGKERRAKIRGGGVGGKKYFKDKIGL
jgi:hypothetical protein